MLRLAVLVAETANLSRSDVSFCAALQLGRQADEGSGTKADTGDTNLGQLVYPFGIGRRCKI